MNNLENLSYFDLLILSDLLEADLKKRKESLDYMTSRDNSDLPNANVIISNLTFMLTRVEEIQAKVNQAKGDK